MMLRKEDIKETKTMNSTIMNQNNDPIDLTDFHQLLVYMIAHTDMITEIWKFFFKQHEKTIYSFIQFKVIVFIMPMIFEPEIRFCIVNAFQSVFGNKFCIVTYAEAIPVFYSGITNKDIQSSEKQIVFSVDKENNASIEFAFSLQQENETAMVQFLGWQEKGIKDSDSIPLKNTSEYGPVLDGIKSLLLFSHFKYNTEIPFSEIRMHMSLETGIVLNNSDFLPFSDNHTYTLSFIKPTAYLEIPLFAKLPTFANNYFLLKPFLTKAAIFKKDYSKKIEITVQSKKRVGNEEMLIICGRDFEETFTYTRPLLYC